MLFRSVVSFTILTSFIDATLPSAIRTSFLHPMVLGLIELAGAASRFHCISPCSAFMILAVLLAWNGACVHLQVLSVTTECGLTMKKYFLGKLAHMLISFLLSFFCAPMIFKETNSTYTLSNIPYVLFAVCTITIFILLAKTPYRKKQSFHI